jgi:hypothetical protein
MRMNTSSRCQVSPGCGRFRGSFLAKSVPNQDQLDVTQAETEHVIQPYAVTMRSSNPAFSNGLRQAIDEGEATPGWREAGPGSTTE